MENEKKTQLELREKLIYQFYLREQLSEDDFCSQMLLLASDYVESEDYLSAGRAIELIPDEFIEALGVKMVDSAKEDLKRMAGKMVSAGFVSLADAYPCLVAIAKA